MDEFIDNRNPSPGDDPPVTAVASRQVKPGREREFEEWVSGILAAANKFPGYLGSEVLRPSNPEDNEYKIIFRFDHASNLHAWENSEERQHWLRQSRPLLQEEEKVYALTGMRLKHINRSLVPTLHSTLYLILGQVVSACDRSG
jgi:uncharacterized protein